MSLVPPELPGRDPGQQWQFGCPENWHDLHHWRCSSLVPLHISGLAGTSHKTEIIFSSVTFEACWGFCVPFIVLVSFVLLHCHMFEEGVERFLLKLITLRWLFWEWFEFSACAFVRFTLNIQSYKLLLVNEWVEAQWWPSKGHWAPLELKLEWENGLDLKYWILKLLLQLFKFWEHHHGPGLPGRPLGAWAGASCREWAAGPFLSSAIACGQQSSSSSSPSLLQW